MSSKKNNKRSPQSRKRNPVDKDKLERRFTKALHSPHCWDDAAPHWKGAKNVRKRVDACYNVIGAIAEKYGDKYPLDNIIYQFEEANAGYYPDPKSIEEKHILSRAAALWMLDEFRENGHMVEALDILSEVEFSKTTHSFDEEAEFYDSYYPTLTVQQMEAVIQDRINWGAMADSPESSTRHGKTWDQYQRILALIPDSHKEAAVAKLQELIESYIELYLECDAPLVQECKKLNRREKRIDNEMEQEFDKQSAKQTTTPLKVVAPAALAQAQPSFADRLAVSELDRARMNVAPSPIPKNDRMMSLRKEMSDTMTDIRASACKRLWINENLPNLVLGNRTARFLNNVNMDEVIAACKPLTAAFREKLDQNLDPYAVCFGYELLIDKNDDIIYMLHEMWTVMTIAASYLPWGIFIVEKIQGEDLFVEDDEPEAECEEDKPKPEEKAPVKIRPVPREYDAAPDAKGNIRKMSIDQIMFLETRTLLPRDQWDMSETEQSLRDSGMPEEYIPTALINIQAQRARQYRDTWVYIPATEDKAPEQVPLTESERIIAEKDAEIAQLRDELASMKRQAYQFEHEAQQATSDLEKERALAKENNSELFNLRELIYTQLVAADEESLDETSSDLVSYPYTVTHRTVVFGGHNTWSKAIQPKLEGVKFVSKDVNSANRDIIRNADIIWIQPNALAHRLFYPIIDTARKYDIPVRYFTSASAQRCADQLVAEDIAFN